MHPEETHIDAGLVRRLLADQYPELAEGPICLVRSTGTVNAIYRLGHDLYVRLPRVAAWAGSLDREWTWLPRIAPHVSLSIPRPMAKGEPTKEYPHAWAVYQWLDGAPYDDDLILDEPQAARDLAGFIRELQSLDLVGAPRGGRAPLDQLDTATRTAIDQSRRAIDAEGALNVWTRSLQAQPWDGRPVWMHGDLLRPNLLVRERRLCAVLDFGGVGIGDSAADVVPAWSVFGDRGRAAFRQALDVDESTWDRARGYALHQAVMIIPYYPNSNPAFVELAKRTVAETLSDLG
jgi:aminoglycoside phosphotransferase (APT) family kinase protein